MEIRGLPDHEVLARGAELVALQRAAYTVEAELIGDDRIPTLHETELELVSAGLTWIVVMDQRIIAALGYVIDGDVIDIDRLMVDPDHHRQGLGARLVTRAMGMGRVATVSTGRENGPARALYASLGFRHDRDVEALPGLWASRYVYRCDPPAPAHEMYPAVRVGRARLGWGRVSW